MNHHHQKPPPRDSRELRAILDHVTSGFLLIDDRLVVQSVYTESCHRLLGTSDLAGRTILEVLGIADRRTSEAIVVAAAQLFDDIMPEAVSFDIIAGRYAVRGRVLQVDVRAVREEGKVRKLLFTVNDATALEVAQREAQNNQVLVGLLRQRDAFLGFLEDAAELLAAAGESLEEPGQAHARRALHTIKGNAAAFEVAEVVRAVHGIEERPQLLQEDLDAVGAALRSFVAQHANVLGLHRAEAESGSYEITEEDLEKVRAVARGQATLKELERWTTRVGLRRAEALIGPMGAYVANVAERLGKRVVYEFVGASTMVDPRTMRPVFQHLAHLIRNAIDHGIECEEERGGKPPVGTIRLTIEDATGEWRVHVDDDGRGIDTAAVRAAAVQNGHLSAQAAKELSTDAATALVFADGITTKRVATETSGRGIGMAAARAAVTAAGGSIRFLSRLGIGTRVTLRVPKPKAIRVPRAISKTGVPALWAYHDVLTQLPNRDFLLHTTGICISSAKEQGGQGAVLSIDLDGFKRVNDCLGQGAGDRLLQEMGRRFAGCLGTRDASERGRPHGTLARSGGDEFYAVLPRVDSIEAARAAAQSIVDAAAVPISLMGYEMVVSASVGVAFFDGATLNAEEAIKNADLAMHLAKERGKNCYRVFCDTMSEQLRHRIVLEDELRRAIDRGELELHYQPKVDAKTRTVRGCEALVRWNHPTRGYLPPATFIPVAEESGLILALGDWVLRKACEDGVAMQRELGMPLSMAVNVSSRQFRDPCFVGKVETVLAETGIDPRTVEIEITEGTLMEDSLDAQCALASLKELGVAVALDDFGTGYSSLSYLRRFKIDILKIDRSFVRDATTTDDGAAIVDAILALSQRLRLRVVAEGVEDEAQLDFLASRGCDEIQGFFFSRAVPKPLFLEWVRARMPGRRESLRAPLSGRISALPLSMPPPA